MRDLRLKVFPGGYKLPTLFTALLAKKGAMPASRVRAGEPLPKPDFAASLFNEITLVERRQAPPGSTVIVIGGGFSGLAAANELCHAGYEVTVLEAQPKLGGRVVSLTDVVPRESGRRGRRADRQQP